MKAIDISKQQALYADLKEIQQINFTGNLNWFLNIDENTTMCFIFEQSKKTILDFHQGTMKVWWLYFTLIWY